ENLYVNCCPRSCRPSPWTGRRRSRGTENYQPRPPQRRNHLPVRPRVHETLQLNRCLWQASRTRPGVALSQFPEELIAWFECTEGRVRSTIRRTSGRTFTLFERKYCCRCSPVSQSNFAPRFS